MKTTGHAPALTGAKISFLAVAAGLYLFGMASAQGTKSANQSLEARHADQAGVEAFRQVASVLLSPRCVNCHAPGNAPLQGDDGRLHNMNVKRAGDGRGTVAMRCANCHQVTNSPILQGPPGAPDWHMPPASTPMAWQGLSTGELCRALKDPAKNGNRSVADLIDHMNTDLVKWAWSPGPGRTVPPMSYDEF